MRLIISGLIVNLPEYLETKARTPLEPDTSARNVQNRIVGSIIWWNTWKRLVARRRPSVALTVVTEVTESGISSLTWRGFTRTFRSLTRVVRVLFHDLFLVHQIYNKINLLDVLFVPDHLKIFISNVPFILVAATTICCYFVIFEFSTRLVFLYFGFNTYFDPCHWCILLQTVVYPSPFWFDQRSFFHYVFLFSILPTDTYAFCLNENRTAWGSNDSNRNRPFVK